MLINRIAEDLVCIYDSDKKKATLVSFLNPYSYVILRDKPFLYNEIDYFYCDGIMITMSLKIFGRNCRRLSFDMTSMAPQVFKMAEDCQKSIFLIGGHPGIVEGAASAIREVYPKLRIIGTSSGYFGSSTQRMQILESINSLSPDIVVVGMGVPIQERFVIDLKNLGWIGTAYTCGGFLHQTAKKGVSYYPTFLNKINLRWLYRIIDEPVLAKRYLFYYPLFMWCFIKDFLYFFWKKTGSSG